MNNRFVQLSRRGILLYWCIFTQQGKYIEIQFLRGGEPLGVYSLIEKAVEGREDPLFVDQHSTTEPNDALSVLFPQQCLPTEHDTRSKISSLIIFVLLTYYILRITFDQTPLLTIHGQAFSSVFTPPTA